MSKLQKLYDRLKNKLSEVENTIEYEIPNDNALAKNECKSSPFRNVKFRLKNPPTISHPLLEKHKGHPISFTKICNMLVSYITLNKLYLESGNIKCDGLLKSLTGFETTTFFLLVKNLRHLID